jgi:hypothetical protein
MSSFSNLIGIVTIGKIHEEAFGWAKEKHRNLKGILGAKIIFLSLINLLIPFYSLD